MVDTDSAAMDVIVVSFGGVLDVCFSVLGGGAIEGWIDNVTPSPSFVRSAVCCCFALLCGLSSEQDGMRDETERGDDDDA